MNKNKNDRHSIRCKRRVKSSVVHDPNGSATTFREFYQSGGRDYEHYQLWLQTLSNPSVDSDKIKKEPVDNEFRVINLLPSAQPTLRISGTHPLLKSVRQSSSPIKSSHSTSTGSQIRLSHPHSHPPNILITSSSPVNNWSVTDVGRFIEKHFPEKSIARKFIQQKIDGRALPLLTEDHLTKIFKMKLGPALRLLALISTISK